MTCWIFLRPIGMLDSRQPTGMLDSRRLGGMLDSRRLAGMLDSRRPDGMLDYRRRGILSLVLPNRHIRGTFFGVCTFLKFGIVGRLYEEHIGSLHLFLKVRLGSFLENS